MDPKKSKAAPEGTREGLEFIVMPEIDTDKHGQEEHGERTEAAPAAVPPPKGPEVSEVPASVHGSRRKLWIVLGVVVGVLVLAAFGYLAYEKYFNKSEQEGSLPGITVADDQEAKKDSDKDGLTDAREKQIGTKAGDADTDGDGLADGDETAIYGSDPLLPDSDGDKFDDGKEVANSFSPAQNSSQKASAEDLRKWQGAIEKYGLHEPTQITLQLKKTPSSPDQPKTEYQNAAYFYSVSLPQVLAYRESADRREVGIYISGSADLDPDFDTDPIYANIAVLAGGQTLKEGVQTQYPEGQYAKLTESKIGAWNAVTLEGAKGDPCPQTKTFIQNKSTVVVLTLTCADTSAFTPFYQDIVQSFKFTK